VIRSSVPIASASARDLEAISGIYDHYVRTTPISFDVEPPTTAWRREWFARFSERGRHRLLVARDAEQGRKFGRYWDVAWFDRGFPVVASATSG
jgi:phosphinothricin acetyltransferase